MIYKKIIVVSPYFSQGYVVLENVSDDDLDCIVEGMQGSAAVGEIDVNKREKAKREALGW